MLTKDHAGVHEVHIQARSAVLVVLGAQLWVAQHLVRLAQLLEALSGLQIARVLVCQERQSRAAATRGKISPGVEEVQCALGAIDTRLLGAVARSCH